MSPGNTKRAARLLGEIAKLNQRLTRIGRESEWPASALTAARDALKQEVKSMGVVFEPTDAVMPEIVGYRSDSQPAAAATDGLTITLTGPQGCGKTVTADFLRRMFGDVAPITKLIRSGGTVRIIDGDDVAIVEMPVR
ncbi:hypothetical protein U1872_06210 [Sphingomonas sp. RB3P16]|uniref:hypothetical protein n=1 Tax=Parasphingomonas frigoris TaxID=3096163 RepID=UPI002FC9C0A7